MSHIEKNASINGITCSRFNKILMMLSTDGRNFTKADWHHSQTLYLLLACSLTSLHYCSYPRFLHPPYMSREKTEAISYHLSQIQSFSQTTAYLYIFFLFAILFSIVRHGHLPLQRQSTLLCLEHLTPLVKSYFRPLSLSNLWTFYKVVLPRA